jgi:hypothetical protein
MDGSGRRMRDGRDEGGRGEWEMGRVRAMDSGRKMGDDSRAGDGAGGSSSGG